MREGQLQETASNYKGRWPIIREGQLLNLLPMGGGGILSHNTIVLAATLKALKLWLPNFVTSCFYLFSTIWENFSKIDQQGGLLQSFSNESSWKIRDMKMFHFVIKISEILREYNFRSEKSFLIIKKVILASLNTNSRGKLRNAMNRSLVKRRILWRHISKNRTVNFLKFHILNRLMPLIMYTKF